MNEGNVIGVDDVVERITDALQHLDGERIAQIYNDLIEGEIRYIGDSLFEEEPEEG